MFGWGVGSSFPNPSVVYLLCICLVTVQVLTHTVSPTFTLTMTPPSSLPSSPAFQCELDLDPSMMSSTLQQVSGSYVELDLDLANVTLQDGSGFCSELHLVPPHDAYTWPSSW